ncbi:MAG: topoisomerase DNA-binding C4 zinc finger domain-containing protein [candidate division WOR-3 bacterium]
MVDPDMKEVADEIWVEVNKPMLKLILSTDGKHSVWVEVPKVLGEEELEEMYNYAKKIYDWIVRDYGTKPEMWEEVMTNGKEKGPSCPVCGGEMVKRKGKTGLFWGCKKYPQCRGTRPIDA